MPATPMTRLDALLCVIEVAQMQQQPAPRTIKRFLKALGILGFEGDDLRKIARMYSLVDKNGRPYNDKVVVPWQVPS